MKNQIIKVNIIWNFIILTRTKPSPAQHQGQKRKVVFYKKRVSECCCLEDREATMGTDLKSFIGQWKSKPEMIKDGGSRYAGVNHSIAQPPSLLKLQSQHNLSSSLPSFLNNVPDIPTTPPSSPQLPQSPVSTAHHPRYLISKLTNTHLDDVIGGGRRRTNSLNLLESIEKNTPQTIIHLQLQDKQHHHQKLLI